MRNRRGCNEPYNSKAAGSGKSEIAVIDFCKYVRIPNFIGIISRRTTPMLKGAGGILTKCKRTFAKEFKGDKNYTFQWKEKDNKFVFYKKEKDDDGKQKLVPISEIYLKHSEHEALIEEYWQGVEANLICLDESTQYTLPMVQYIMSRMRNPSCESVRPKLKMTCNPMYSHFLRKWVEPYLKEDGTPDRSKDGMVRYFTFSNGDFVWGDSREEVAKTTGASLEDVLSFTFISATVVDNSILQKVDPRYVSWLKGLKGVDRQRLLEGNWFAKEEGSSYFLRAWLTELDQAPPATDFVKIVRAYDFAMTLPSDTNPNPDYTTSVKMGKLKTGEYVILDIQRDRIRWGDWLPLILKNAQYDGRRVDIIIPQDAGAYGKAGSAKLAADVCSNQFSCVTKKPIGKLEDFKPFAACAQNGTVYIVKDCGNDHYNKHFNTLEFYYSELEVFTGKRSNKKDGHDDLVDSTALAFIGAASRQSLNPAFLHGINAATSETINPLLQIR